MLANGEGGEKQRAEVDGDECEDDRTRSDHDRRLPAPDFDAKGRSQRERAGDDVPPVWGECVGECLSDLGDQLRVLCHGERRDLYCESKAALIEGDPRVEDAGIASRDQHQQFPDCGLGFECMEPGGAWAQQLIRMSQHRCQRACFMGAVESTDCFLSPNHCG